MSCKHTASGCEYPSGECTGACLARPAPSQPATSKRYLTIVYEIHSSGQEQALLHSAAHESAQHCHAIKQRDELLQALNEYREKAHSLVIQRGELVEAANHLRGWIEILLHVLDAEMDSFEVEVSNSKTGESETLILREHFEEAGAAITRATAQ